MYTDREYISWYGESPPLSFYNLDGEEVSAKDLHFVWKSENYKRVGSKSEYSDRMFESDSVKFRNSVAKVWPTMPDRQFFHCTEPADINEFLNLYLGKGVKLTAILMGYNASTDYPYWMFIWEEP